MDQTAHCTHSPLPKEALIGSLRAAIMKIEGHELCGGELCGGADCDRAAAVWRLGCPAIDRLLPQGLDLGGVHEVKAAPHENGASAGDWMTGLGFALRLAVRRTMMARVHTQDAPWLLWCWPRALASEFGAPSARGLTQLGLDPSRLLIVETARAAEALAALEDGLKSSSLGLAFGIFDEIALTPARRLSLAAATGGTPCLLVTHPAAQPSGATSSRWRVGRYMSAPHAYDARAPGNARFRAGLERCRSQPESTRTGSQLVEWCDETRTFGLASGLALCAADAGISRRRAKG